MSTLKDLKNSETVLNKVEVVYDFIKCRMGVIKPGQKSMINLRKLHDHFLLSVSKEAEAKANEVNLSFVGKNYMQSYIIAKKINGSTFEREHIEGGLANMFDEIIKNYDKFNSPQELLNWILDNSPIVLRLKEELNEIHQYSKYSEIKHLVL